MPGVREREEWWMRREEWLTDGEERWVMNALCSCSYCYSSVLVTVMREPTAVTVWGVVHGVRVTVSSGVVGGERGVVDWERGEMKGESTVWAEWADGNGSEGLSVSREVAS
jgi:hypothetical protein